MTLCLMKSLYLMKSDGYAMSSTLCLMESDGRRAMTLSEDEDPC